MLQGTNLLFVDAERNTGISKSDRPYDIGRLVVSDSLESIELPCLPQVAEDVRAQFRRGDAITITVDAVRNFGKHVLTVTKVEPSKKAV